MTTPEEVAEVRRNTAEPTAETWDDDSIEALVNDLGILSASATIWRQKAGYYANLVDVTEAGSSHRFSELYKNALAMAAKYENLAADEAVSTGSEGHAKVRSIERALRE